MRAHYKNITEAMTVERPFDRIIRVLSNKFCVAQCAQTNGTFQTTRSAGGNRAVYHVFGLGSGTTVYSYGNEDNIKDWCKEVEQMPNVKGMAVCYDFPANKKYGQWLYKHNDQRKYKQSYRKILKLI
jgi:hypothetical protein